MHKLSKTICLIVLCCFSVSTFAGSMICCVDMSQKGDMQQMNTDLTEEGCEHTDPPESDSDDCCQDMNLCNGTLYFAFNSPLTITQLIKQINQSPANIHLVYSTTTPPTKPPKLIS